jgi:hypothetical protein
MTEKQHMSIQEQAMRISFTHGPRAAEKFLRDQLERSGLLIKDE